MIEQLSVLSKEKQNNDELAKAEEWIRQCLLQNDLHVDVWISKLFDESIVVIDIRWGDWKHDHLRCNLLMEEMGFEEVKRVVTETDGSDTYSAQHYFVLREMYE